jgi:hypothetical protein
MYLTSIIRQIYRRYDCKFNKICTFTGRNALWTEIIIGVRMPLMNCLYSNLSSRWNYKYVRATVLHSATSTELEYLLENNVPVIIIISVS